MRLLCLSDLHGDVRAVSRILQAAGAVDVILLGGDITHFGTPNQAEEFILQTKTMCPRVFAVAGNCDSPAIDERLVELGVSLFRRGATYREIGFFGVSAMPPWMGNMYELSEEEIADALEIGERQTPGVAQRVALCHAPPRDCQLDRTRRGEHVGSLAIRRMIDKQQPALVVCGHIHEGRGIDKIGKTTVVNCGPTFRGDYAVAQLNDTVDVELLHSATR